MSAYIEPIMTAAIMFPAVAFIISGPFILTQYHRYGAVSLGKAMILYSFVLYLMCAYFLVILPLPDVSEVAALTTPRCQWIPFRFVTDFLRESPLVIADPATYVAALKDGSFLVPVFNVLLTVPFGVYLRYYFKAGKKTVVIAAFLLSLFFEVTQLTGLYFIYPRGYRLFDVDDLMLNTLGGFLGYLAAAPVIKLLPTREELDSRCTVRGRQVSGLRRTLAFTLDMFIFIGGVTAADMSGAPLILGAAVMVGLCFVLVPYLLKGQTVGERFLHLRVEDSRGSGNFASFLRRAGAFALTFVGIPVAAAETISLSPLPAGMRGALIGLITVVTFASLFLTGCKYLFTDRPMFFEKITDTRIVSTIL